jgi:hypothetical protein
MNLREKLKDIMENFKEPEYKPYIHKQETAEELFIKVVRACEARAKYGCGALGFHWDYVYTNDRDKWNKQHEICLEVVRLLKKEGLKAFCPNTFEEPYTDFCGEKVYPDSFHSIEVSWDSSWFPYPDGEEE